MVAIKTLTTSLLAITAILVLGLSCSDTNSTELTKAQQIDALIQAYARYGDLNAAVLVSHNGKIVYKNAFGLANREWNVANQTDTKFRLASVTKQFTAMLLVQLAAENKLDLHAPIRTYLPNYPLPQGDLITAHHLLTHSSGIHDYKQPPSEIQRNPDHYNPLESIEKFRDSALTFPPGDHFEYSNSGYDLLAYMAEKITDSSYHDLLQKRIFDPVGMTNSGLDNHREVIKNRAAGYFKMWGTYANANYVNMKRVYASGGIYSTVEDLFLWDRALANHTLLNKKQSDLLFTPFIADPDYHGDYGYGWELSKKRMGNTDKTVFVQHHDGVVNGFCALISRIPDTESSIIILSNKRRAPLNSITRSVLGILYNETYDTPKKSVALETQMVIKEKGLEAGVLYYNTAKEAPDFYLSEQEFIVVGYEYLQGDDAETAAQIFKLAIDAFPEADNPYDSYAEAQMTLGNKEEAIRNYKKSVALNPNNKNALNMIKKLEAQK